MKVFDTNAILHFLLRDEVKKAARVRDTMERETCFVPTGVLAEVVYVLWARAPISYRIVFFTIHFHSPYPQ